MVDLSNNTVAIYTGWVVLQRIPRQEGGEFIAPTFWETRESAELFASSFDNAVAIIPIDWEE